MHHPVAESLIIKATNLLRSLVYVKNKDDLIFSFDHFNIMVSILAKFIVAKGIGAENFTPQVKQTCLASLACLALRDGLPVQCVLRCDGLVKELVRFANFTPDQAAKSAVNTLQFICDVATNDELLDFFELAPLFLLTLSSLLVSHGSATFTCTICTMLTNICRRASVPVLAEVIAADCLISAAVRLARDPERRFVVRYDAIRCIFLVFGGATSEQALHVVHLDGLTAVMELVQSEFIQLTSVALLDVLQVMKVLLGEKFHTLAEWNVVAHQMDARGFWKTLGKLKKHSTQTVRTSADYFVRDNLLAGVMQKEGNGV